MSDPAPTTPDAAPRHCYVCGREVLCLPGGDALPHAPDTSPGEPSVCLGSGVATVSRAEWAALETVFDAAEWRLR